jgi:hypothetical protein
MREEKKVASCPFYMREGSRCVLVPQIREYEKCGKGPCKITDSVMVRR